MGNFNMLSGDLISNILTRLPTETVLDCKLVSKSWHKVINRQQFAQSHLIRCLNNLDSAHGASGGKFTVLLVIDKPFYANSLFHYLEFYDENYSSEEQSCHRVTRMKLNPAPFNYYNVVGSCNGLVCLNGSHDNQWVNYEPVYVCNPVTRECVFLPEFERPYDWGERLLTGFGYVSETNEYKVVRMYYLFDEPNFVIVEVYTLGSGKGWRNLGKKINKEPDLFVTTRGVFLDGSLYWELGDGSIVAFDLANEVFVELPKSFPTGWKFTLGVMGGYLLADHYDKDSGISDVFLFKKKEDGSLGWIKEFSIRNKDTQEVVQDSLGLTCRGTLLCRSKTKVLIHDFNSSSSKVLVDFGQDKDTIYQAIPHMNTLVSLRALGEENTKTMESVDVPREVDEEYTFEFEKKIEGFNEMCMQQ